MTILAYPWLASAACFVAGFLLARWLYRRPSADAALPRQDISDAEIEVEVRAGRKVEAIKLVRRKYGYDLKTAVATVETMAAAPESDT